MHRQWAVASTKKTGGGIVLSMLENVTPQHGQARGVIFISSNGGGSAGKGQAGAVRCETQTLCRLRASGYVAEPTITS